MATIITCPTGLKVEIRGVQVRDGGALSNRKVAKNNMVLDEMLRLCTKALDLGLYELPEVGAGINWGKVVNGDRDVVLMHIRGETHGYDYHQNVKCEECGERYVHDFDLRELFVRELCQESREAHKAGHAIRMEFDGTEYGIRLVDGDTSRKMVKRQEALVNPTYQRKSRDGESHEPNQLLASLETRVISVNGDTSAGVIREAMSNLSLGDINGLTDAFDEHDCGLDNMVESECPGEDCGAINVAAVPFDRAFFFPQPKRKR